MQLGRFNLPRHRLFSYYRICSQQLKPILITFLRPTSHLANTNASSDIKISNRLSISLLWSNACILINKKNRRTFVDLSTSLLRNESDGSSSNHHYSLIRNFQLSALPSSDYLYPHLSLSQSQKSIDQSLKPWLPGNE